MTRSLVALVAVALLAVAGPARAHVEVAPKQAVRGQVVTFSFTVVNEEAPAKTNLVEVRLPAGVSHRGISAMAPAGWTYAVTSSPGGVSFSGGTIAGTDKAAFAITLLVPATVAGDQVAFEVVQTYDNAKVVRWADAPTRTGQPKYPAPIVRLSGAVATTSEVTVASPSTTAAPEADDDASSRAPLIVFVALGLAGVGAGIAIAARRRGQP